MRKLRNKFIFLLALFIGVVGFGLWLILNHFFPDYLFQDYFLIPLFFLIVGLASTHTLTNLKLDRPNKLLNTFMLIRGIKMVFALGLTALYWLINEADIKEFAIVVVVFYLLYLFFETYIYIQLEKCNRKKLSQKNNQEDQ